MCLLHTGQLPVWKHCCWSILLSVWTYKIYDEQKDLYSWNTIQEHGQWKKLFFSALTGKNLTDLSVWSKGTTCKWKLVLLGLSWGHAQFKMHQNGAIAAECWLSLCAHPSLLRREEPSLHCLSLSSGFGPCNWTWRGRAPANSLLPPVSIPVWTWPRLTQDVPSARRSYW